MITRRRYMGGIKKEEYIKDGLIFWLDGIDKGNDPSAWIEQIHGYSFTGTATREDDCYSFNGSQYLNNSNFIGANANDFTIEFCIEVGTLAGVIVASNNWREVDKDVFVEFDRGAQLFNDTICYYAYIALANQKQTCAFTNTQGIINGSAVASGRRGGVNWDNARGTNIGARYPGNGYNKFFTGKIHAIRVYNRQLSASEMLHNQILDNKRFNLGLNI